MGTSSDQASAIFSEGNKDNRQCERVPFRFPVKATIHQEADGTRTKYVCHVLTQDLSGCGVSIVCARRLCEGQRVDLAMPDGCRSVVICRVVSLGGGRYLTGCRFEDAAVAGS